jgi:predicted glycosyltransferase
MGKPHISMEDSGNMEQIKLYRPFTKSILTPDVLPEKLGEKQIRYNGYHEIAYLHPKYFKPDAGVKHLLGLKEDERYCIVRFVSWRATHDLGHSGFSSEEKMQLISKLSEKFKVFISSEAILPDTLKQYQIKLPPHLIHHALAFAEIVISEGATIASEAGVLGTPSIYVNSIERSYNENQEKYGTVFNFRSGKGVVDAAERLISKDRELFRANGMKLIADKIDVTAFMIWFIEHYPESYSTMKNNPDYQLQFK